MFRPRARWTMRSAGSLAGRISCSSTARSGRTRSSPPRESMRRRRATWGTSRSAGLRGASDCCRGWARNGSCSCTSTIPIPFCVAARPSGRRSRPQALSWGRMRWSSSCECAGQPANGCRSGPAAARRPGAPLSPPPSLQPADASRRAVARRAPALGGESLLLSDQHSRQGRPDPRELPRARGAAAMDPADRRPRRTSRRSGRHRGVAATRRSHGGQARGSHEPAVPAAGRALCRRRVRELLPVSALARGGGGVAHRNVRAAHRQGAAGGDPRSLQMGGSGRAAVLQEPAAAGAARRGVRAGPRDRAVPDPRRAGSGGGGARVQVRRTLVPARRRRAGAAARHAPVSPPPPPPVAVTAVPRLHPKARLQHDDVRGRDVLLYPEGLVALNPTGAEILELCDGVRSVAEVVATLERRYGAAGEGGVERDVTAFLDGLAAKGLVTYGS